MAEHLGNKGFPILDAKLKVGNRTPYLRKRERWTILRKMSELNIRGFQALNVFYPGR